MEKGQRIRHLRLVDSSTSLARCLDMFLLHLEAGKRTPRTIDSYQETLSPFVEFLNEHGIATPQEITADHIRRFLVHLDKRGLADATIHKFARSVKAWLNFLVREELLDDSPMRKVGMPKVEKTIKPAFSTGEIQKLLKSCHGEFALRNRAIVLCLLDSGLRASEFLSLKVGDVDADGMIKVRGKGRKERYVRVGATARKALLRYLADRDAQPGAPLWMGRQGALGHSGLNKMLRKLGERAGVENCHPHRFRTTFATWSAAAGMDAHGRIYELGGSARANSSSKRPLTQASLR